MKVHKMRGKYNYSSPVTAIASAICPTQNANVFTLKDSNVTCEKCLRLLSWHNDFMSRHKDNHCPSCGAYVTNAIYCSQLCWRNGQ